MISSNKHKIFQLLFLLAFGITAASCNDDNMDVNPGPNASVVYELEDQVARPAVNTVFNSSDMRKNEFNVTPPAQQFSEFGTSFVDRLNALNPGYTTNALGLDDETFAGLLATDVLNVATQGKTTFFDGVNVLTGRTLDDDVIDVELLLIFGGPDGMQNPGLTTDNVDSNDKAFLQSFPYLAAPH